MGIAIFVMPLLAVVVLMLHIQCQPLYLYVSAAARLANNTAAC
jgi:hypothetical protein